jgi:hypothetical protein
VFAPGRHILAGLGAHPAHIRTALHQVIVACHPPAILFASLACLRARSAEVLV